VTIEPTAATVVAGTPQPFVATVTGNANTSVTWNVQEGASGGTISSTGVYTAPTAPGTYHVVATSQADTCGTATAEVTVEAAPVISVAISPADPVTVEVQGSWTFSATVTGSANSAVTWSIQEGPTGGTIGASTGVYDAPNTVGIFHVVATSVADPSVSSLPVEVNVVASTPVSISPVAITVGLGGHVDFKLSNVAVGVWSVDGIPFGDDAVGTITGFGAYTAPYLIPAPTTVVTVTQEDAANSASVTVVSRFLTPEDVQVDDCDPVCEVDEPNAIVAADVNDDGLSDLATANTGTGTVSLLTSADESHFADPYRYQVGDPSTGDPEALVIADINQDSKPDLVIADADPSTNPSKTAIRIRLGLGGGAFGDEIVTTLPAGSNPVSIAAGHIDSDPDLDVVVASVGTNTNTVEVLQGAGNGSFVAMPPISTGVSAPLAIAVADFNADSWDDLAVVKSGSDTVSIYLSNADGTFAAPQFVQLLANSNPSAVAVVSVPGTLNNDNFPDLVVTTTVPTGGLTVILNVGPGYAPFDPRFIEPDPLEYPIATGSFPIAVATGNFNRDSAQDVVVANRGNDTVTTYFWDPASDVLVQSETYTVGQTPQALAVGDFNGDGWDDVAVVNNDDDTVSILRNRGGPTFTP
jgi:hypothetical protein